jgi:hypothetical protein
MPRLCPVWLYLLVTAMLLTGCGATRSSVTQLHPTTFPRDYFQPGGVRTLTEARVPKGPVFAIIGERYRFEGKISIDLAIQMEPHTKLGGGGGSFSPEPVRPFTWSTEQGCSLHPPVRWSIMYGLLRDPSARAYAYTRALRHSVLTAPIPASLHLTGALGYVALSEFPSSVLVHSRAGKVIQRESFGAPPKERCDPGDSSGTIVFHRSAH